jgi:hypothetical protein
MSQSHGFNIRRSCLPDPSPYEAQEREPAGKH